MQNGELSHQLGFIIKGALRTFTINQEGEDISFLLQVDSDFLVTMSIFLAARNQTGNYRQQREQKLF
jgi:hypothetical protein